MCWKKMPYWLKGGLISIIIVTLITLILYPFQPSCIGMICFPIWSWLLIMPPLVLARIFPALEKLPLGVFGVRLLSIIISSIFYFLIGAIIGFIYCKIKSKKGGENGIF